VIADAPTKYADEANCIAYGGYLIAESIGSEADARLIAAAPDLLAVCKELVAMLNALCLGPMQPGSFAHRLEAAILKAEAPCRPT
jgi:hypothetical protein